MIHWGERKRTMDAMQMKAATRRGNNREGICQIDKMYSAIIYVVFVNVVWPKSIELGL